MSPMREFLYQLYNGFLENLAPLGGRALRVKIDETSALGAHLLFWGTGAPGATTCNCPATGAAGAAPGAIYMRFDGDGSTTPVTYVNIGTYLIANWSAGTAIAAAATLTSLAVTGDTTLSAGSNVVLDGTTGTKIGTSATAQKLGFFNATPIVQPTAAAQKAVLGTGTTQSSPYGFATAAQGDDMIATINAMRTALVNLGIMKGS